MLYTVYKTTNTINGKIYVGYHATVDANDSYLGSGKLIKRAIKKYGKEAFVKEIMFAFDNPEGMLAKEAELVDDEFKGREDTYNLVRGGASGWSSLPLEGRREVSRLGHQKQRELYAADPGFRDRRLAHRSTQGKASGIANGSLRCDWRGRKHKEVSKQRAKDTFAAIAHQQGAKNSQFGSLWVVHSEVGSRKIKAEELPVFLEQGWHKGRKIRRGPTLQ